MQLFEPIYESSHSRLVFLISWKTTGKQMVVTVLRCSSGIGLLYVPFFRKKTGYHLLETASCASNFCGIWLILKQAYTRLLFTFGLIRVNSQFITCHDVIDVFRSTAIVFLEHVFRLFLSH